jgi:hypothetical protein
MATISADRRRILERRGLRMKPGWQTYYDLGREASKRLPAYQSWAEIGKALDVTPQNAFTEMAVALGKVVFKMRELCPEKTED